MMIAATARRDDVVLDQSDALNDIVISRGAVTRTIRLDTYIER